MFSHFCSNFSTRKKLYHLFDTSLRDGIQSRSKPIGTEITMKIINHLEKAGITNIELGSFVNPKKVPSMANTHEIVKNLAFSKNVSYWVLIPNIKGLEKAFDSQNSNNSRNGNVINISMMSSIDDSFSFKNAGCNAITSQDNFIKLLPIVRQSNCKSRIYLSCSLDEQSLDGSIISLNSILYASEKFFNAGCDQIVLCNTLGKPLNVNKFETILKEISIRLPINMFALHLHGQKISELNSAIKKSTIISDITTYDTSLEGGGCPSLEMCDMHNNLDTIDMTQFFFNDFLYDINELKKAKQLLYTTL